jgi:hypothetical protein
MDTDLTAIKAALADISDTELAAFIVVARCSKPRRSGACAGVESFEQSLTN